MEEERKNTTPMHPVVELVTARLGSHPEEHKKWQAEVDKFQRHLTKEEKALVGSAMRAAVLDEAHKNVMKLLLAEPVAPEEPRGKNYIAITPPPKNAWWDADRSMWGKIVEYAP